MNYIRIGRALVCLLLVCCLILNISPIRAEATSSGLTALFTAVPIPAKLAIATAVIGVGVYAGTQTDALDTIVTGAQSLAADAGYIVDDMITAIRSELPDGTVQWLFPLQFLEDVRDALWEMGVVKESDGFATSITCSYPGFTGIFEAEHPFAVGYYTRYGNPTFFVYSNYSQSVYATSDVGSESSFYLSFGPYGGYYVTSASNGSWTTSEFSGVPYLGEITPACTSSYTITQLKYVLENLVGGVTTPTTDYDLILGDVGTAGQTVSEAFPEWTSNATTVPGSVTGSGSDDQYIPVGLPANYNSALSATQDKVQSGVSDYVDSGSDDETEDVPVVPPAEGLTGSLSDTKAETFLDSIFAFFTSLFAPVTEFFENFWAFAEYLIECLEITLADKIEAVTTAVASIPAAFSSWLEKILEWLAKIWDLISALPGTFVDVITEALVWAFVPSESYLDAEVTSLCSEFPLADSMKNLITSFRNSLTGLGGEPPVIYIHLEDYEGSHNIGGTVPILDMRWYARYKPTVDTLLSSLLWIFFIWRVLVHAPSIISGVAGDVEAFNSGPSGGYFSADNPYRGQFERPARGRFESRRNRK